MFDLSSTICAICTPPGIGGIAAIRISGKDAWEITNKIFVPRSNFEHMRALYGRIVDNKKIIDEVVVLPFKSPRSYTAEDVIEIYCHGGNKIVSMILDLCLKNGARSAKGGEFTFRAFVNGRIDLTYAEAINEVIFAESEKGIYAAQEVLSGSLQAKVNCFREKLFNLITTIEGSIEFPLDVEEFNSNELTLELNMILEEINSLLELSKEGQVLREGIKVVIIGAPNVGKSSLLNQLLENNRAIVTPEVGTTRDTIEEKVIIGGWTILLIDTAGIREKAHSDSESIGIERSKLALKNSDIVLLIFDLSIGKDKETRKILNLLNTKPTIIVGNKFDLIASNRMQVATDCDINISAKYGTNIEKLKELLVEKINSLLKATSHKVQANFYVNQRQKELLLECSSSIRNAINVSNEKLASDLIADELKKAISKLDEVTGKKINDDVIKNIFAKFCIGK